MSWSEIKKAVNSDLSTPLNELINNKSVVKRVQRGNSSITSNTVQSINISSVNTSKSLLIFMGQRMESAGSLGSSWKQGYPYAYLSSSTTISAYVPNGGSNNALTCYWQVIEFY